MRDSAIFGLLGLGMQLSINFDFLTVHDAKLVELAARAEYYFQDDPATTIIKLRQFAELMAKLVAAQHAAYEGERETFEAILRRLSFERIIPKAIADVFHALRKAGEFTGRENVLPIWLAQSSNTPLRICVA